MPAILLSPPPTEETTAEAHDQLEAHVRRMLRSPHFARAETQRRLLEYLWLHRKETLSEYALATEALGRSASFDSTLDASVRVHISRLRRKLKDYYQLEAGEPELIVLPTGTHQLIVVDRLVESIEVVETTEATPVSPAAVDYQARTKKFAWLAAVFAGMTVSLFAFTVWQRHSAEEIPKPTSFWAAFLQGNAPIKILLPTPTFFRFKKNLNFRIRSTNVNDFQSIAADPAFLALTKDMGDPELEQSYTVTWDTLAAIDMARYLDTVGNAKQRVSFDVTRDSSMTVLEQSNVIALGTHQTLQPLHEYLQAMNFSLSHDETDVMNAHPIAGEQSRYPVQVLSKERVVRPSLIAVLPGRAPGLRVLLLQSRDTAALVSMLSSGAGSHSIAQMLHKNHDPQFYEMVVNTELENNHALRSWPVAVHAFASSAPSNAM